MEWRLQSVGPVLAATLTLLLLGAPVDATTGWAVDAPHTTPDGAPVSPTLEVRGYPAATGGLLVGGLVGRGVAILWLPVGASFPVRDDFTLDVEVGLAVYAVLRPSSVGWSGSVAVGPTWYWGAQPRSGFFVGPRFQVQVAEASFGFGIPAGTGSGPVDLGPRVKRGFFAGCDAGYLWRTGRWSFGPMFGLGLGYVFDHNEPVLTPFNFGNVPAGRPDTASFTVNLNLFRLGATF